MIFRRRFPYLAKNVSVLAVTESSPDTSILHITLLQPISDMTKEDEQLVLLYLMEHILLHIDEVLVH